MKRPDCVKVAGSPRRAVRSYHKQSVAAGVAAAASSILVGVHTLVNRVVRAIAPVEDIILEGEPVGDGFKVDRPGRLSGLRLDNSALLLLADYASQSNGTLTLNLDVPVPSRLVDRLSGEVLAAELAPGPQRIQVPLGDSPARLLHMAPRVE